MKEKIVGGVSYLTYDLFEPCVKVTNVVTTRRGGMSAAPYDTLNLGLHVDDDPDAVLENRAIVAQILGFEPESLTLARQVHGSSVAVVRASRQGRGAVSDDDALAQTDALVTNEPDIPLGILVADCVAVSLYDPSVHAVGIAHAGWRGTLTRIVEKTVKAMSDAFGTEPDDLLAGLSPSIGRCHYAVGAEVAEAYAREFGTDAASSISRDDNGQWRLDLAEANYAQLLRVGVRAGRVERSGFCTACTPSLFYSHRRDGSPSGRIAGIVMLHGTGPRSY